MAHERAILDFCCALGKAAIDKIKSCFGGCSCKCAPARPALPLSITPAVSTGSASRLASDAEDGAGGCCSGEKCKSFCGRLKDKIGGFFKKTARPLESITTILSPLYQVIIGALAFLLRSSLPDVMCINSDVNSKNQSCRALALDYDSKTRTYKGRFNAALSWYNLSGLGRWLTVFSGRFVNYFNIGTMMLFLTGNIVSRLINVHQSFKEQKDKETFCNFLGNFILGGGPKYEIGPMSAGMNIFRVVAPILALTGAPTQEISGTLDGSGHQESDGVAALMLLSTGNMANAILPVVSWILACANLVLGGLGECQTSIDRKKEAQSTPVLSNDYLPIRSISSTPSTFFSSTQSSSSASSSSSTAFREIDRSRSLN